MERRSLASKVCGRGGKGREEKTEKEERGKMTDGWYKQRIEDGEKAQAQMGLGGLFITVLFFSGHVLPL